MRIRMRITLYLMIALCIHLSLAGVGACQEQETAEFASDPFFGSAKLTPTVSSRWLFKEMILAIIDNSIDIEGLDDGKSVGVIYSKEALQSAITRVSFLDAPAQLVEDGQGIDDETVLGFMRMMTHMLYNYSDITEDDFVENEKHDIDVGGKLITIPTPKYFAVNRDKRKHADQIIVYTELSPPLRAEGTPIPECVVGIVSGFGEGFAGDASPLSLFNLVMKKMPANNTQNLLFSYNTDDYTSALMYENGRNLLALSFVKIKNRIIAITTQYPWRSMDDYGQAIHIHQGWRDAILSANRGPND